jgi:predicted nuclease of predicted toxin-antitoxin system
MKFLANENFPLQSFRHLLDAGYDIIHIGIKYPSVTDEDVINISINEDRIILTFDSDYGTLVFRKGMQPPGVIYLRFKIFSPDFPAKFLLDLFESKRDDFQNMFTVIDDNGSIRQRKIPH